jgi:hypothetical protein
VNVCRRCKRPARGRMCSRCRSGPLRRKRKTKRGRLGLCLYCGKRQALLGGLLVKSCMVCYMRNLAKHHLGSQSLWRDMVRLYIAQGGRCYFTGRKLVLGWNASIDHLTPRSRVGGLRHDIKNLAWVLFSINCAKGDKTEIEFRRSFLRTAIAFCEKNGMRVWPS